MTAARAYWVAGPGHGELRQQTLPGTDAGRIRMRALCSGVSSGTERLVGLGLVPESCGEQMRCPHMAGSFALPVKYGYSLVGELESGPHRGRRAFAMHPHQDVAMLPQHDVVLLPDGMPPQRAILLPNLETALNAVWDADLVPGQRVLVVGGGLVGLLVAWALRQEHGITVVLCERHPIRLTAAAALPWIGRAVEPSAVEQGVFHTAFHTSGQGDGLQLAIDALGFEGTVVELSWYGMRSVPLQLGGGFHFRRNRIVSSQVGTVANARRGELTARQRLEHALELLSGAKELDALLSQPVPFAAMPEFMHYLYRCTPGGAWAPYIDYEAR
jgi:threonine dehydrogenase-like Zn-dependent dehydrogenase